MTLDSHTNTVISQTFAYSSRWRWKPWQGLLVLSLWCPDIKEVWLYIINRKGYESWKNGKQREDLSSKVVLIIIIKIIMICLPSAVFIALYIYNASGAMLPPVELRSVWRICIWLFNWIGLQLLSFVLTSLQWLSMVSRGDWSYGGFPAPYYRGKHFHTPSHFKVKRSRVCIGGQHQRKATGLMA